MKKLLVSILAPLATLLTLTQGVASAEPVAASALEKTVAKVQPSIVYVDIVWTAWIYDTEFNEYVNDAKPFTQNWSCSGFVIDPEGYIATAGHCVDPKTVTDSFIAEGAAFYADFYNVKYASALAWAEDNFRLEGEGENAGGSYTKGADLEVQAVWSTSSTEPVYDKYGDLNGTPVPARVVGMVPWDNGAGDTAILQVDVSDPLVALPLASSDTVGTGTDIISVGYPALVGESSDGTTLANPSFKEGSISSIRTTGLYPVYEISAPMSNGMSGGPTVNLQGEVVGINSYGNVEGESSFEFIQSITTLDDLLGDEGIDAEVGEPGTAYRAGLTAYYAGDKDEAVENLTKATETASDFEMADEFLVKAKALPDPTSPVLPIAVAAGTLLVLVGGLLVLVNRRKKAKGGPTTLAPAPQVVVPVMPVPEMPTAPLSTPDGQRTYAVVPDKPE